MFNVRAAQMTISLVGMVICHQNRTMNGPDIMEANGITKSVATVVDPKIFDRNPISIIANNRADEAEPPPAAATNSARNVM